MLELSDITVRYGPFLAVENVSLRVDAGEIVGLVGPNGAGKSSLVKTIGGLVRPVTGRVVFGGKDLSSIRTHERIGLGISVVPEGRGLFANMSVEENLLMGAYLLASKAQTAANIERSFALFPMLAERRRQAAGTLSASASCPTRIFWFSMSRPLVLRRS
jgi:branched-chain amino acid transport system ATP-binding protein